MRWLSIVLLGLIATTAQAAGPQPSASLDEIKSRGALRCGVTDGTPGFASSGLRNDWSGLDVDLCRTVAAAIFGDPAKAVFVHVPQGERFDALLDGQVDLLPRASERVLTSPIADAVSMPARTYMDGQGFLVPKRLGALHLSDLRSPTVCLVENTAAENRLSQHFAASKTPFLLWIASSYDELQEAYDDGRCDAWSGDVSFLAAERMMFPKADEHTLLPDLISRDPSGPLVRRGDATLAEIVKTAVTPITTTEHVPAPVSTNERPGRATR